MIKQIFLQKDFSAEDLLAFSQRHPWSPVFPVDLVRRFLTELISSPDLIFDLHDEQGRVATAVLLDQVKNPAKDACLEIIGIRPTVPPAEVIPHIFSAAREKLPGHCRGFQFGCSEKSQLNENFLTHLGLTPHYQTYEMALDSEQIAPQKSSQISAAQKEDVDVVYDLLCKSFAKNPEASIPHEQSWKANFLSSPKSHFFVWKDHGRILGFAMLLEEGENDAEIRLVGVAEQARGKGVGSMLLQHCLAQAQELSRKKVLLTVAASNQKALGIYTRAGFAVIEKFYCYRMAAKFPK